MYKIEISKIRESNVTVFLDGDVDTELLECFEARNEDPLEVLSELVQLSTGKYSVEIHQQQPKEYTTYNYKKVEKQKMEQTEKYVVFKNKQTGEYMERDNSDDILAVKFAAFKEKLMPLYLLIEMFGYEPVVVEKIK